MKAIKRIDIIVDHLHTRRVVETLEAFGVEGYSVVPGIRGRGHRGMQYADGLTEAASNDLIFTTLAPGELESLAEKLRPLLRDFGGICLVSDAAWLEH